MWNTYIFYFYRQIFIILTVPYKGSTKVYILHTKTQKGLIKWRETTKRTPTEFIQSIKLTIDKEETPVHALTYFGKKATNMQWGRLLCLP